MSETSPRTRHAKPGLALPGFVIETLVTMVPVTAVVLRSAGWTPGWLIVIPLSLAVFSFWGWRHVRRRAVRPKTGVAATGATARDQQRRAAAATLARTLAAATTVEARKTAEAIQVLEPRRPAVRRHEPLTTPAASSARVAPAVAERGDSPSQPDTARAPGQARGLDDFDPGEATRP